MLTKQVGNLTGPGDAASVAHVADAASIAVFWDDEPTDGFKHRYDRDELFRISSI